MVQQYFLVCFHTLVSTPTVVVEKGETTYLEVKLARLALLLLPKTLKTQIPTTP